MKFKNRKLIWYFRIEAILDVIFSKRFELKTFKKGGLSSSTKFDYEEIKNANLE